MCRIRIFHEVGFAEEVEDAVYLLVATAAAAAATAVEGHKKRDSSHYGIGGVTRNRDDGGVDAK